MGGASFVRVAACAGVVAALCVASGVPAAAAAGQRRPSTGRRRANRPACASGLSARPV